MVLSTIVKGRNIELDIIKGIAIIMMVWGHIGLPGINYISLFHMAVFFIVSGAVYKGTYSDDICSLTKFVKNKVKSLYIPYAIVAVFFTLMNNFFIRIGFYDSSVISYQSSNTILVDCIRGLLFARTTQMGGATWFLRALFFVSIFYAFIEFLLRRIGIKHTRIVQLSVSLILLCIVAVIKTSVFEWNSSIYYFVSEFTLGLVCFSFGGLLSRYCVFEKVKTLQFELLILIASVSVLILYQLGNISSIGFDRGDFYSPLFFSISSFCGFVLMFCVASLILRIQISPISKVFIIIGQNTLPVVLLHLLVFKIGNLFLVWFFNMDSCLISCFPTIYDKIDTNKYVIGLFYLCIGIIIPVVLNVAKKKLIGKLNG